MERRRVCLRHALPTGLCPSVYLWSDWIRNFPCPLPLALLSIFTFWPLHGCHFPSTHRPFPTHGCLILILFLGLGISSFCSDLCCLHWSTYLESLKLRHKFRSQGDHCTFLAWIWLTEPRFSTLDPRFQKRPLVLASNPTPDPESQPLRRAPTPGQTLHSLL